MIISGSARDGFVAWAADESGNLTSRKTRGSRAHRGARWIPPVRDAAGGKPQLRFHRRSVEVTNVRDRAVRGVASMLPATIAFCMPDPVNAPRASQIETTTRPRIDCREDLGVIVVHDPRLLRRGREAFCTALVREAVGVCGALRAEVNLASSEFRVEFAPGRFDRARLAEQVARAVRAATPSACDPTPSRTAWLTLTAFQAEREFVRSAPKTHQQLSRVPGVGRVLRRVGMPIHPGADRRALLATVGWSLLTAVAFVIVHPPLPVVLALEFGLFTLCVARR